MNSAQATSQMPKPGSGAMFDRIADRYDFLNRVISLGLDRRWRRRAVAAMTLAPQARVLDLATGTGDLALEVFRQVPGATVVGLDPSRKMLALAAQKGRLLAERLELVEGQTENLAFPDASFDGITIGFGIRNAEDRPASLREMARVTRPGGRVAILELNEPPAGLFGWPARFYVHNIVPWLGARLADGAAEYDYLQRSIAAFPPPAAFAELMRAAGLEVLKIERLGFGACSLFIATPGGRP